jgi:ribonuclease-3
VVGGGIRREGGNHSLDAAVRWAASRLCYEFSSPILLQQALTHRSAAQKPDNERLEFLGDAFLNLVIAEALFRLPLEHSEGDLTKLRATLVRGSTLADVALELGLDDLVILGAGDLKTGGARRGSTLANALEAVVGAILLDGGMTAAKRVVLDLFSDRLAGLPDPETLKDPKTRLQEWLQARGQKPPEYQVTSVAGSQHNQTFHVECRIGQPEGSTTGVGSSRRRAEQESAHHMLNRLEGEGNG